MKKNYSKPMIEVESYKLSASIAANCKSVISLGPGADGVSVCDEFKDAWEVFSVIPGAGIQTAGGKPFYEDGTAKCTCYYSSGGGIYFTS